MMKNAKITIAVFCAGLLFPGAVMAEPLPEGIALQAFGGVPLNFPTTLKINQQGEPEINHAASWESRPWEQPMYWALRLRWQREHDGIELQFLHHKMFLKDNPATIQHFEVTHGFNILTANYMRRSRPVHWRVGARVTLPNTFPTIRGDRAVACGFDDGADTLQVILERTASTEWTKVTPGGPSTRTFFCVALSEDGTIFVGGIEGAGGMSPKAFLALRNSDGLWADLLLPDPEVLHGVNDILIASDGSIYLACMGEGENSVANLVHADAGAVRKEITSFPGGLLQLGEAGNGDIYAVGFRRNEQDGSETGVMLVKTP